MAGWKETVQCLYSMQVRGVGEREREKLDEMTVRKVPKGKMRTGLPLCMKAKQEGRVGGGRAVHSNDAVTRTLLVVVEWPIARS